MDTLLLIPIVSLLEVIRLHLICIIVESHQITLQRLQPNILTSVDALLDGHIPMELVFLVLQLEKTVLALKVGAFKMEDVTLVIYLGKRIAFLVLKVLIILVN